MRILAIRRRWFRIIDEAVDEIHERVQIDEQLSQIFAPIIISDRETFTSSLLGLLHIKATRAQKSAFSITSSSAEDSADNSTNSRAGFESDADPTLWNLTKTKFVGYFRWTAFAMLLGPLAFWIISRK